MWGRRGKVRSAMSPADLSARNLAASLSLGSDPLEALAATGEILDVEALIEEVTTLSRLASARDDDGRVAEACRVLAGYVRTAGKRRPVPGWEGYLPASLELPERS